MSEDPQQETATDDESALSDAAVADVSGGGVAAPVVAPATANVTDG